MRRAQLFGGVMMALVLAAGGAAAATEAKSVVLVAGATGRTGQQLVQQLIEQGHAVRALVRDAGKARAALPAGIGIAVADVRDPDALATAMQGVTYVVSAIGAGPRAAPGSGPREVDFAGVRNLALAAKAAGVRHFVLVSSAATTRAATYPMEFMRPILAAKLEGEAALRSSGVTYTIVRPGGLLDEPGGRRAIELSQGDTLAGRIPRADVAAVCVAALGRESA